MLPVRPTWRTPAKSPSTTFMVASWRSPRKSWGPERGDSSSPKEGAHERVAGHVEHANLGDPGELALDDVGETEIEAAAEVAAEVARAAETQGTPEVSIPGPVVEARAQGAREARVALSMDQGDVQEGCDIHAGGVIAAQPSEHRHAVVARVAPRSVVHQAELSEAREVARVAPRGRLDEAHEVVGAALEQAELHATGEVSHVATEATDHDAAPEHLQVGCAESEDERGIGPRPRACSTRTGTRGRRSGGAR
jgi:hypothetical protein